LRWLSLAAGLALLVVAFAAGSRVADTREGLIAEVVALLGGLAGVSLVLYGMFAGIRSAPPRASATRSRSEPEVIARPVRDLALGAAGIGLALFLVGGLAVSGGVLWAGLGSVLLVPMIAGSIYLCVRFARAPARDWTWAARKSGPREES